jgi:hypothetical protein
MAYRIEPRDGYTSVLVWGTTSKRELLQALRELQRRDPVKAASDLWTIGRECVVPFAAFTEIVEAIRGFCVPGMVGNRTAIIVADGFQRAQFELYRAEAADLPFEIGGFASEAEAVAWLTRVAPPGGA